MTTPEAPASASVRFQLEGFEWLFTIREFDGETPGRELLARVKGVNEAIVKMGGAPIYGKTKGQPATPVSGAQDAPDEKPCPIHNVMMKKRTGATGTWWSHKLADGEWCNGGESKS